MTNYEKIKSMSVEEMARFMCDIADCYHCPMKKKCRNQTLIDCLDGLAEWLLQEGRGMNLKPCRENCADCKHQDIFWSGSGCNLLNNGERCKFEPKEQEAEE